MEGYAVEVGNNLINGDWRSSVGISKEMEKRGIGKCSRYPEKRSVRRDWMRTFW